MHQNDENVVKVSFKCPASYKAEFKNSHCLLVISVGQPAHEGEIFRKTIQLINDSFRKCTILVDDSIQRHTLAIENPSVDADLYQQSILEGDMWLERNKKTYSKLTIPYHILRWDHWFNHCEYASSRELMDNFYKKNSDVKEAFHTVINKFLSRYEKRTNKKIADYHRASQLCLDYLLEECAAMYLWSQEKYSFEIYPSGRNAAMKIIYAYLVNPHYPESLRSVSLYIRTQLPIVHAVTNPRVHTYE